VYECAYSLVSGYCASFQMVATYKRLICSTFPLTAAGRSSFARTFNPKVAGSIPARPMTRSACKTWQSRGLCRFRGRAEPAEGATDGATCAEGQYVVTARMNRWMMHGGRCRGGSVGESRRELRSTVARPQPTPTPRARQGGQARSSCITASASRTAGAISGGTSKCCACHAPRQPTEARGTPDERRRLGQVGPREARRELLARAGLSRPIRVAARGRPAHLDRHDRARCRAERPQRHPRLGTDAEHLVLLLDSLPDDLLWLLAFERVWDEERRRLDADYWDPLP
jgi:hypothetical protein